MSDLHEVPQEDVAPSSDGDSRLTPGPTANLSPHRQNNNHSPESEKRDKSADHAQLLEYGLDVKVADRLDEIYQTGKLQHADLDDRALDALKEFPSDGALAVLDQFLESNLEHVSNKSAYLCGVMKTYRQKARAVGGSVGGPLGPGSLLNGSVNGAASPTLPKAKGPDEAKIQAILDRTGYTLDVTTGQRKYGGPPPGWEGNPPGQGCEVFCGKISRDLFEDDLIPLFEKCGTIWDLRLMMDPMTGLNRGYAFITFTNRDAANEAVRQLDSFDLGEGKRVKVNVSEPKTRLFIGNIPKSKGRDEIQEEFEKLSAGLKEVIIYSSPDDKKKNRGFCFLEYESHKAASLAKRRLETSRVKVWSCDIIVDWADPQEEPDHETMSQVKVLYVRNLTANVTEENIRDLFEAHGRVERVKKIKDYAFVHFEDRKQAVAALEQLNGSDLCGAYLEISLAKPPSDKKKKEDMLRKREQRMMKNMAHSMALPPFPPFHSPFGPMAAPPGGMYGGRGGAHRGGAGHHMGGGVMPRGMPQYDPANWFAGYYNWNWAGDAAWPGRGRGAGGGMAPWMGGSSQDQWGGSNGHASRSAGGGTHSGGNQGYNNNHHHHHHHQGNSGGSSWANGNNLQSSGGASNSISRRGKAKA